MKKRKIYKESNVKTSLKEILGKESILVNKSSMEVLKELEKLQEELLSTKAQKGLKMICKKKNYNYN